MSFHYYRDQILSPSDADAVRDELISATDWEDGQLTAGKYIKDQKVNKQLRIGSRIQKKLSREIYQALDSNEKFCARLLPSSYTPVLFSKTVKGGYYKWHYDNPIMGDPPIRVDASFTVALSDPEDYEGGKLCIQGGPKVKLNKGEILVYPSDHRHQVSTVTSGTRYVAVGWISCLIRDQDIRNIITNLYEVQETLCRTQGFEGFESLKVLGAITTLKRKFSL